MDGLIKRAQEKQKFAYNFFTLSPTDAENKKQEKSKSPRKTQLPPAYTSRYMPSPNKPMPTEEMLRNLNSYSYQSDYLNLGSKNSITYTTENTVLDNMEQALISTVQDISFTSAKKKAYFHPEDKDKLLMIEKQLQNSEALKRVTCDSEQFNQIANREFNKKLNLELIARNDEQFNHGKKGNTSKNLVNTNNGSHLKKQIDNQKSVIHKFSFSLRRKNSQKFGMIRKPKRYSTEDHTYESDNSSEERKSSPIKFQDFKLPDIRSPQNQTYEIIPPKISIHKTTNNSLTLLDQKIKSLKKNAGQEEKRIKLNKTIL